MLSVLRANWLDKFPVPQVNDKKDSLQDFVMVRHLESKYNEYRRNIVESDLYKTLSTTSDPKIISENLLSLLEDFKKNVGLDYMTWLSTNGHAHGEKLSKLYAAFVAQFPDSFPDFIAISPYLRTRMTAHYFLKSVDGLDLDIDSLLDEENYQDMVLGSFKGKDIVMQLRNDVRERSYGIHSIPAYLKKYFDDMSPLTSLSGLPRTYIDQLYYFTGDNHIEAQTKMEERAWRFHSDMMTMKYNYKKSYIFTHEQLILGWINVPFGGSYRTFSNFYNHWRPVNGSMTILSKLDRTQMWQENKLRVAGYNLMLEE